MYEIESESKWHIKLNELKNIEDATDEFFTEEELREMLGMGDTGYINTYAATVKRNAVIEILSPLMQEMKEKGKKSIIIDDSEFIDFLKEFDLPVSDFIKGLRRVGNRLSIFEKAERKVAKKQDAQNLISLAVTTLNKEFKFNIDIKYAYEDYASAIRLLQKLVTWDQLVERAEQFDYYKDKMEFIKQVWDEPDMFQKD
jgi:hypothetical protein